MVNKIDNVNKEISEEMFNYCHYLFSSFYEFMALVSAMDIKEESEVKIYADKLLKDFEEPLEYYQKKYLCEETLSLELKSLDRINNMLIFFVRSKNSLLERIETFQNKAYENIKYFWEDLGNTKLSNTQKVCLYDFKNQKKEKYEMKFIGKQKEYILSAYPLVNYDEIRKLSDDDLLEFEILKMIENNITINRCENCNHFFIPAKRVDTMYCNEIYQDGKTCAELGSLKRFQEKNRS